MDGTAYKVYSSADILPPSSGQILYDEPVETSGTLHRSRAKFERQRDRRRVRGAGVVSTVDVVRLEVYEV